MPKPPPTLSPAVIEGWKYHQRGQLQQALASYASADQSDPLVLRLLATARQTAGEPGQAGALFTRLTELDTRDGWALLQLGNALLLRGDRAGAVERYRQAIFRDPTLAEANNNLGFLLMQSGDFAQAGECFEAAVKVRPDYAEAHGNLGYLRLMQQRLDESQANLERAVSLRPDLAAAQNNLGNLHAKRGRTDQAIVCYQRAISAQPTYSEAINNLGLALMPRGKLPEATVLLREAARLRPDDAQSHSNLGAILFEQMQFPQALEALERAIVLDPQCVSAHWNRGMARLLSGDWLGGWPDFTWWRRRADVTPRLFKEPLWDGAPLNGRRILLHEELGVGDIIQFVRYAPLVKARGGVTIVECPKRMMALLRNCPGVDEVVADTTANAIDVHAPLMDLPAIFKTTPQNVPASAAYLSADPQLVEKWRAKLSGVPGLRIGVCWQGNPKHPRDYERSLPLSALAPLADRADTKLISLQKGAGREQMQSVPFSLIDLGDDFDEASGMFMDAAAVMKNLDLVITVDSAIAHLAGATGARVWVLLPVMPDWRWMLDRADTPWYPMMRLHRQREPGNWAELIDRVVKELDTIAVAQPGVRIVAVETSPGELLDKICILEIKSQRITDPAKLRNVKEELSLLRAKASSAVPASSALTRLVDQLSAVNRVLWDVEDQLRLCESERDFGPRFVELARSVYRENDRRAALKREINQLLGSPLVEEKSYRGG